MRSLVSLLGLLGLLNLCASANFLWAADAGTTLSQESHTQEIPLHLSGDGPWYRLTLPMSIRFAAAHADLRDLRVVNAAGESLPFGLVESESSATRDEITVSARIFPLYLPATATHASDVRIAVNAQGHVIEVKGAATAVNADLALRGWLLDLGETRDRLQRMTLQAAQIPPGFQHFSIEASTDLQHWQRWPEGQWVNLSFDGSRLEQDAVPLAGGSARYLRLLWREPAIAPLLSGATLISATTLYREAALTWSEPLPPPTTHEEGSQIWRLPLALPLARLRIEALPENTVAPVQVSGRVYPHQYTSNTQYRYQLRHWRETVLHGRRPRSELEREPAWQLLARSVLTRVTVNQQETLENEIGLPSFPVQQLRLQWDDRGSGLGAALPVLRVAMRERGLVFLARGAAPYRLVLGDVDANAAHLPLDTLIPGYQGATTLEKMAVARIETSKLGGDVGVSAVVAPEKTDQQKYLLWGILLAGVGLLAGMVWQLLRRPAG